MKHLLFTFHLLLITLVAVSAAPPVTGEYLFQKKPASGLYEAIGFPGTVSPTEFGYLDGVTSSIQTQLNSLSGLTIGDAITGGSNNQVLIKGASGLLGQSSSLTFSSGVLTALNIAGGTIDYNSGVTDGFLLQGATNTGTQFVVASANGVDAFGLLPTGTGAVKLTNASTGYGSLKSNYERYGSGTPEGAETASIGTIFHRTNGSTGTSLYIKESGSGNTGWVPVSSGGGGLTIGTTVIASGTSGRVLYDNAGVVGEKDVTGTGDVMLNVDPVIAANAGTGMLTLSGTSAQVLFGGSQFNYNYSVSNGFKFIGAGNTGTPFIVSSNNGVDIFGLLPIGTGEVRLTNGSAGGLILENVQVASGGSPSANSARIYVLDNAGTAAWYTKNEAGSETIISPHDATAPAWMYDKSALGQDRMLRETNEFTGVVRYTNETRRARLAELMLDAVVGSESSKATLAAIPLLQRKIVFEETFAEHNARRGLEGEKALVKLDWNTEQEKKRAASIAKREAWIAAKAAHMEEQQTKLPKDVQEFKEPEPEIVEIKPSPLNVK